MSDRGWIGVDLDGTLAVYDGWKGIDHIGEPVPVLLEWVKSALADGVDIRIFTARVQEGPEAVKVIEDWCLKHLGKVIPVTDRKDFSMVACLDDRAIAVEKNAGVCFSFFTLDRKLIDSHWSSTNGDAPKAVSQADGDSDDDDFRH